MKEEHSQIRECDSVGLLSPGSKDGSNDDESSEFEKGEHSECMRGPQSKQKLGA